MTALAAKQSQREQQAAYEAVLAALNQMGEGLIILEKHRFRFVNEAFCNLCGYSEAELLAMPSFVELLHESEVDTILERYRDRSDRTSAQTHYETRLRHRDGESLEVEFSVIAMRTGKRLATVVAIRDISARKRDEQELRLHRDRLAQLVEERTAQLALEKEWAQATLQSVGDAVITTGPSGIIGYLNPAAEQLTGWERQQALGQRLGQVLTIIEETSRQPVPDLLLLCQQEGRINGLGCLSLLRSRDGRERPIEVSAAPIRRGEAEGRGYVIVLHDVSEQRQLTQQLSHQATHDSLTGLANRHAFEQRLRYLVDDAGTNTRTHTLCYLDLDQFKVVNDTCGHVAGDELLRQLGHTLQQQLRRGDTLARLGGDEFGVLLENCAEQEAVAFARTLLQAIQDFRFRWADQQFSVGACIGVVEIAPDTEGMTAVLRAADTACFAAKDTGRNRIHLYQANDAVLNRRQGEMQWVARIGSALEEGRFCLYYQPIVGLGKPSQEQHWELLLRLRDTDGSIIPPGVFIPAAERYNLMPAIDRWVIRHVIGWCAQRLRERPGAQLPVCGINLSGVTFSDQSLVPYTRNALLDHQVPASCLCFEITETAAIANISEAVQFIGELKQLGCQFALDDFGSGMSSFAYLKNLPVDYLKIDGNFVRDMVDDPIDHAMVEAINRVGQVMGIRTIAEYVENDAIRAKLAQLGVDFAQGFGIARPAPLELAP